MSGTYCIYGPKDIEGFYHGICLKGQPWSCHKPLGVLGMFQIYSKKDTCLQWYEIICSCLATL